MFWMLFGAATLEEMDVDMIVLFITSPVDPLLTPSILEGWKRRTPLLRHASMDGKDKWGSMQLTLLFIYSILIMSYRVLYPQQRYLGALISA